ncbi:MAG: sigma-54-dependent transcriptional regulator [Hyphomicrobiales bacterium]
MSRSILVVDDDPAQRRILEEMVRRFGYHPITADGGQAALDILTGPQGKDISLLILDLVMPDLSGMEVLESLKPTSENLPVIVQTAQGSIDTVVQAMRAGADDFVVKPVSPERLKVSVQNALKVNALAGEITRLKKKVEGELTFDQLILKSPAMDNVARLGQRAAQSNIPVLIEGESGVGKEMIARAIQGESDRTGKPFVSVNCGAIPENLVESLLFGHEKGSFTGATGKHNGKFLEANGGTLFLDEIGELPLDIQVKLLRALQEGEIDPVGAKRPVQVDVRIISATNRDLIQMVKDGEFREDLYYRLNVFPILVPPLRERPEDIAGLVDHFVTRFSAEEGRKIGAMADNALALLKVYDWPGNVRQLENAVFRAVVLAEGDSLTVAEFPQIAAQVDGYEVSVPEAPEPALNAAAQVPEGPALIGDENAEVVCQTETGGGTALGIPAMTDGGDVRRLEEIEADMIRLALQRYRGHMSEVARKLGIGRSTLYRKVRELGLEAKM